MRIDSALPTTRMDSKATRMIDCGHELGAQMCSGNLNALLLCVYWSGRLKAAKGEQTSIEMDREVAC